MAFTQLEFENCPQLSQPRSKARAKAREADWGLIELKLDRLIDEMRFLKSHTIAFDTRMRGIEAYLKAIEPSEQQPESKPTPWLAAAASATARRVLFTVGAAVGAALTKTLSGNMT
jgi:hypothetical protein